jgi:hypothetical protein
MPAERATHTIGRALRRPLTSQRALPILVPETRSNCWQRGVANISEVPLRTAIEVPFATRARRWDISEVLLRTAFWSIALEHLIVTRGATARGRRTEWVDERGGARDGSLNAYAAAMGCRFLSLGRSRCSSGGAQNNCRAERKFRRGQHFRLLVRWESSLLRLRAHRCAYQRRGPPNGLA